ncbi:LysM peptidoglycan-binding domain-containing protein [Paenibacillus daejeonensis]|uniref:LysM peptidoglycan-binding domain-containing protein n=1 Tax=Paenibacillus daejeonensis TaxID=135193 RepID=UPI00037CDA28|nr:LysM peptidoglycan-binding domain-containing protein [Paenibacillus daejeonensis]
MLDPNQGLRFDVYERVHLSDEVAAIDELEEIELTPHIEIIDQEEQVLLRGNLLLSGLYNSQQAGGTQLLEYWIPVEITLPMNRVHRLEDLAVDIDNFDVDLLSARTLSITGVLSLRGILGEEQSAYTEWEPAEEPFTVVHRAQQQPEEEQPQADPVPRATDGQSRPYAPPESPLHAVPEPAAKRTRPQPGGPPSESPQPPRAVSEATAIPEPARISEPIPVAEPSAEPPQAAAARPAKAETPPKAAEPAAAKGADPQPAPQSAPVLSQAPEPDIQPVSWTSFAEADEREKVLSPLQEPAAIEAAEPEDVPDPLPEPLAAVQPEEALPAKQEMKIAFSGKRPESAESESGIGLKSLLSSSRKEQESRPAAEEEVPEPAASASNGDEVEWKRLFLSNAGEETEFRRIRMCIVQREETLEEIAERYQLGSREIVLYNRLPDHSVSEGQVLHIP